MPFTLTPEDHSEPLSDPEPVQGPVRPAAGSPEGLGVGVRAIALQGGTTSWLPTQHILDKKAVKLLQDLEAAVEQIPTDVPSATSDHRLNVFAVEPHSCVAEPGEDDWFILNQMMKSSFGWGEKEMAAAVPELLNRGRYGLDGFIRFMAFFVQERGLQGALFETKVEAILKGIEDR